MMWFNITGNPNRPASGCSLRPKGGCSGLLMLLLMMMTAAPGTAFAQEVYFSISGGSMPLTSGDDTGRYDYWIRPAPEAEQPRPVRLEVFDAGLGGVADVILGGQASTETTYSLFPAASLYAIDEENRQIRPATAADEPLPPAREELSITDEARFLSRWVSLFELEAEPQAPQGFMLRVETDEGNDINNYRIRLRGPGAEDWELITLNLSAGLISSAPENRFQFRPLWADTAPPPMQVSGNEDSEVFVMDAFGERYELGETEAFPDTRLGKQNTWALVMTGSEVRINNRVTRGTETIVPFHYDPVQLNEGGLPEAGIVPLNGGPDACLEYGLRASYNGGVLDPEAAEWRTNGQTFTGRSFRHSFGEYGSYDYEVIMPVLGRHVPRYQVQRGQIRVNQPPVLDVSGYEAVIAPGDRITLDASASRDPDAATAPGSALSYSWFLNDELRSEEENFTFSTSVSGDYTVRLRLSDNAANAACTSSEEEFPIRVNTRPYAEIEFKEAIAPEVSETAAVVNDDDADGDPLQFSWQGSGLEGGQAAGRRAQIRHEAPGRYVLRLDSDDQSATRNAGYTTEIEYKVNAAPVPEFSIPGIIAPGIPLALDASASRDPDAEDQPELAYSWQVSDGRSYEGPVHQIDFDTPGDYEITLRLDDGVGVENSVQELSRSIRINEAPVAAIAAPEQSNSSIVQFDASGSSDADQEIVRYEWDFGDGNTATGAQPRHTYASHGSYTVTLTVDDGTGVANSRQSAEHSLRVNLAPVAAFSAPAVVAPGQPIRLDGSSSSDEDGEITRWSWFLNGRELGRGPQLEHQIDAPGSYNITLQVRDDSPFDEATASFSRPLRVNAPPRPRWSATPAVTEPGRETVFDASASTDADTPAEALSYRWIFSDDEQFTGPRITREFSEPGMVYFTLEIDDGEGLANSVQQLEGELRVNQSPIVVTDARIRSNSRRVGLNAAESYDPEGRALDIRWELPDGSTREEASFVWTAPETGVHALSVRIDDGEGLDNSTSVQQVEVLVNTPPVAVTNERIDTCTEQVNIFSSARSYDPDGDSFTAEWDFGDGNSSREANPVHTYSEPGDYQVRLSLDDGFVDEPTNTEIPVRVEASPQALISELPAQVCAGAPVRFDGSTSTAPNGIIESYSWTFGDGSQAGGATPTHLFSEAGNYEIILTVTGSGSGNCPNISQQRATIEVVAAPQLSFSLPETVAPGEQISLDARDSEYDDALEAARWRILRDGEQVQQVSGLQQDISIEEPGHYEVVLELETANAAGCGNASLSRALHVNETPELSWNLPEAWPQHQPLRLSAAGSEDADGLIENYEWFLNDEPVGTGLSIPLPTDSYGTQNIRLVARDDAGVANSQAELNGQLYLNPAPVPDFSLPEVVYEGEQVELQPAKSEDTDGNPLESAWRVDGEPLPEAGFVAENARYSITLSQSDRRGLENSEQSVRKTLRVVQAPQQETIADAITLPDRMIAGYELAAETLQLPNGIVLLGPDNAPAIRWQALAPEEDSQQRRELQLGWQPRENGDILQEYTFSVMVLAPLQTLEEIEEIRRELVFNPLNGRAMVEAPAVNREADYPLRYRWLEADGGRELALGPRAHLPAPEGRSTYLLHISGADNIPGSAPLEIPVIFETQPPE